MRQIAIIRHLLMPLKHNPFHPQWFIYTVERKSQANMGQQLFGLPLNRLEHRIRSMACIGDIWRMFRPGMKV